MRHLAVIILYLSTAYALKCWNCVGTDCEEPGGQSWEVQECRDGAYCQSVSLEIYDKKLKKAVKSTTTRSCTYELGCREVLSLASCRSNIIEYGSGCTVRKCCAKDLCNSD